MYFGHETHIMNNFFFMICLPCLELLLIPLENLHDIRPGQKSIGCVIVRFGAPGLQDGKDVVLLNVWQSVLNQALEQLERGGCEEQVD